MAQVTITQLPQAQAITGSELVPIVQNGVTVQTTTGAIAQQPTQTQTFLTATQQTSLPNSRYLAVGTGLDIVDGGAQDTLQINLTGAPASLISSGNGIQVKTAAGTLTARAIDVGTGLGISNEDGVNGDPLITLGSFLSSFQSMSGSTGLVAVSGGAVTSRAIAETANETVVSNGDGLFGNPTIGLADNLIVPGTGSITVPNGTTGERVSNFGSFRYNTSLQQFEGYTSTGWNQFSLTGGVTSFSAGTTGFTPSIDTTGAVTLAGILVGANGGTGINNGTKTITLGGNFQTSGANNIVLTSVGATNVTLPITGILATQAGTETFDNKIMSGSTNTFTNLPNSALTNSSVTYNGVTVALGASGTITAASPNALTIGTGLNGSSYDGSAPVTIALANTAVTSGTYGSATQVPQIAVNAQGQITSASNVTITAGGLGAITAVNGTTDQVTSSQVGTVVTVAIADAPLLTGPVKVRGTGVSTITPFAQSMQAWEANFNGFEDVYVRNLNNGSDASADFVAYNDASDVNSYFIDMGMNSSNFTSVTYPIFTPNSGYLFTGGGLTGQQSDLFIGTSNPASDIIFFTGDVQVANQRGMFNGTTGNFLLGTATDTGYMLNVNGTSYMGGAATFGSTVLLNADPTLALQAVTKQYVDSAVSTGFVVHTPVVLATTTALAANTYNNGTAGVGATLTANANGALSIDGVATTISDRVLVKDEAAPANNGVYSVTQTGSAGTPYILTRVTDFDQAAAGEIANNAYFFVSAGSVNAGNSYILSQIAAITVGATALPFTEFNNQLNYIGGTNIDVTGLTISLTGTVAATNGGTGTSTVAVGDLLYGSAANTWSKLALGSAYKSLVVNASGTQLEWNAVALNQATAVSGQLGVGNGGTSFASYTTGDMIYASGSAALSKLALGTEGQVMVAGASGPTWGSVAGGAF